MSIVGIAAFFIKEPPRGQFEKDDVLGELIDDENPAPISMEAAFARLKRIRTIRTVLVAFCALGFGLFSQGSLASLYLDDTLQVDRRPASAACILSLSGIAALPLLPVLGGYFDRTYRQNPAKALAIVGVLILPSALFTPLQFSTHSEVAVRHVRHPAGRAHDLRVRDGRAGAASRRARTGCAAWAPRMGTMYIFFIGGFLGGHPRRLPHRRDQRARRGDHPRGPDERSSAGCC